MLSFNTPKPALGRLPLAERVEAVRPIPKEIKGLERQYLEALQKHVRARTEYNPLVQDSTPPPLSVSRMKVQRTALSERVELLRLKKRHEELQILQRYMAEIKDMPASKQATFDLKRQRRHQLDSLSARYRHPRGETDQPKDSVNYLVRRLEMAVISAKYRVDREHSLLTKVEQDNIVTHCQDKQKNRSQALAATRDELVSCIEDKLSTTQSHEMDSVGSLRQENQTESPIKPLQSEIMEKYHIYLKLRQRMLDLMSDLATSAQHLTARVQKGEAQSDAPILFSQPQAQPVLPFLQTQIWYPTQVYRFQRQQNIHLTSLVNTERSKTTTELSRLADESHLLLSYPMLFQRDRFKHATAAIAARSSLSDATTRDEGDETSKRMDAWAFAADAAILASEETIRKQVAKGSEAIDDGEKWVERLRELLGRDGELRQVDEGHRDETGFEDDEEEGEDVWAVEAALDLSMRRQHAAGVKKGLWAGLQGDMGMRTDV